MSKPLKPLTSTEFEDLQKKDPYYRGRWPYLQAAIALASQGPHATVLELGPYHRTLFGRSDAMDLADRGIGARYVWDARKTPWPVEQKYDLFLALQVWEHLGTGQADAFREVQRVAKRAVLSFPYKWNCNPNDCHHQIDDATIRKWTCGVPPDKKILIEQPMTHRRLVCLWRFK